MATTRDMTKAQFAAACDRRGFKARGFMGYFSLGPECSGSASIHNAGERRRDQLAYLVQKRKELMLLYPSMATE